MGPTLATRLADWIDELGLTDHLAAAGLPSFTRDASGAPSWIEADGEPLSDERLAELDASLRDHGDDPAHGVPVALVLLARKARLRAELLATPAWTYDHLAEVRGASLNATRFWVHKQAEEHHLLTVAQGEHLLVPAFQLTPSGDVRPELLPVLEPLLAAGTDPWDAWIWLTQPAGLLGGDVPERLAADPEEAALVAHAATRLAQRVTASPKPRPRPAPSPVPPASGGCGCGGHH
ncbi:hypothetical protein IEQ44_10680 [Nocardioides sp. Y6]|uniref:DUF2384 domain-containing protein n=1 Tax=Nocardioides malaquae TaxID=2773426 RepID=A0ABR9RU94_9ACTN|nr:hypothetical protein [Nocardioides malaquae]MBE7325122.1 hypothetical protein [Nocardioides malaquae]